MFTAITRTLGRVILLLATMAFLTALSLLLLGSFVMTWPVLRRSPRDKRMRAAAELASAGLVMLSTFQRD